MGSPIALFTGVAVEPVAGPVPGTTDLGDGVPFDVTLGLAIASAVPVTPVLPAAARAAAEPVLELILTGEWLPDEPEVSLESDGQAPGAAVGDRVRDSSMTTSSGEPMVLEKNLDSWLAAFGRRELQRRPVDATDPDADPNVVATETDADPNIVRLDEPARLPQVPNNDRLTTVVPSIGAGPTAPADLAAPRDIKVGAPPEDSWAGRRILDHEDGGPDGLIDAETLLRTRSRYEPVVDVGGFGFPALPDAAGASDPLNSPEPTRRWPLSLPALPDAAGASGASGASGAANPPERRPLPLSALPEADSSPAAAFPVGRTGPGVRVELPATPPDLLSISGQAASPDRRVSEVIASGVLEAAKHHATAATEPGLDPVGRQPTSMWRGGEQSGAGQPRPDAPPQDDSRPRGDRPNFAEGGPVRRRAASEPPAAQAPTGPGQVAAAPAPLQSDHPTAVAGPVAPAEPNSLDRIAHRVDHLTLDLKDEAGDYGRLRVSVSGPLVRATIMPNDPAMADRLNLEIRQLKTSLEERGFPEPKLTVQAPRAADPAWAPVGREVVAEQAPSAETNAGRRSPEEERRDRWAANRDQRRDERQHQDHPRHSRRDHHGEPK